MNPATRIVLITGAGSGIGRQSALLFWQAGYAVVLAGRRLEALRQVAAEAGAPAARALIVPTDVRDPRAVADLFGALEARFGRLDVLFNNAGVGAPGLALEELAYESWRAVLDTCLTGAFLCTQQAFKLMKRQNPRGGRIINNGSVSAHVPRPNSAAYTAAKHAISGLSKSTELDGRAFDIHCGQIDIGNAATEMAARMRDGVAQANGTLAPEPTFDPIHAARAVLYMASLPLDVNVPSLTVMASGMPYIGRG